MDGPGGESAVENDIAQLLYKTSLDPEATYAIAQGATIHAGRSAKADIADPTDTGSTSEITVNYQNAEQVLSLMNALAEDRTNTSKNNGDQAVAGVSAATTLLWLALNKIVFRCVLGWSLVRARYKMGV
ncbi:MAG: hypothetical protein Q4E00_06875 [Actinomyces bowdenii]|nr:hypothetical protein [Actinomyces bowdenii]